MAVVAIDLKECINCGWCRRVCPTETIKYFSTGHRTHIVEPDGCIDCGICEPECPWEAIFQDQDVPEAFKDDVSLNARTLERPGDFAVPETVAKPVPSPDQVRANRRKWEIES